MLLHSYHEHLPEILSSTGRVMLQLSPAGRDRKREMRTMLKLVNNNNNNNNNNNDNNNNNRKMKR